MSTYFKYIYVLVYVIGYNNVPISILLIRTERTNLKLTENEIT